MIGVWIPRGRSLRLIFRVIILNNLLTVTDVLIFALGVGVYIFAVLANNLGPNVGTLASYTFAIDGDTVGEFVHVPDARNAGFIFNVPGK